jgi:hypothetical protein
LVAVPVRLEAEIVLDTKAKFKVLLQDHWRSTVIFAPAVRIQLGGVLDLQIDPRADLAHLIGTPVQVFGWNGPPSPGNNFDDVWTDSRFLWDLSHLYSDGSVQILHRLGDANDDAQVDLTDLYALASHWRLGSHPGDPTPTFATGDFDGNGVVDAADLGILARNWQMGVGNAGDPTAQAASLSQAAIALGLPINAVPEPAGAACVVAGSLLLRRRRRVELHAGFRA